MPGLCLAPTSLYLRYSHVTEVAQARHDCTMVGTAWGTGSGKLQVHSGNGLPSLCHNCTQLHCTQKCTSLYLTCGSTRVPIALTVPEASTAPGTVRVQQMHSRLAHSRYASATALPRTAPTAPRYSVLLSWRATSALTSSRTTAEQHDPSMARHLDMNQAPTQLKDVLASPHFHQCLRTDLTDPRLKYR